MKGTQMICIGSRDWQDLLEKFDRIAVATESIATSIATDEQLKALVKDVKGKTAALGGALPPQ